MAKTWQGTGTQALPASFMERKTEGTGTQATYEVKRVGGRLEYSATLPDSAKLTLPVEVVMGGTRHGLSFLERIEQVEQLALDRPALIEGRYAYSVAHRELVLSPGFALETPQTYEDALGRVLSSTFEQKCLQCHGKPGTLGAGKEGGVRCESCHGPAFGHLAAVGKGKPQEGVVSPARLNDAEQLAVCAPCHTGLAYQSDPLPDDLLVSNQANALRNAECFMQSGGRLTCTGCHDPHADSPRVAETTTKTCLSCHGVAKEPAQNGLATSRPSPPRLLLFGVACRGLCAPGTPRAAICPVNAQGECIGCHMPAVQKGSFHMTDHWIRVHPEQGIKASQHDAGGRSQITPVREFLRLIVTNDSATAQSAGKRVTSGEPFRDVARELSIDPSAPAGGYIGLMELSQLDPTLAAAAAKLWYGETSGVVETGGRFVILDRLPRDFKWEADQFFQQGSELRSRGDVKGALLKDQQALAVYPYFLRAMIAVAAMLGEAGDVPRAAELLRFAVQSYPKDSSAQFNLALTLGSQPAEQIAAFERAIELDPEMLAAYESLGAALYTAGRPQEATDTFRKGLMIDPLSAKLNYNLGLILMRQGEKAEGERRMDLALKADPSIGGRK